MRGPLVEAPGGLQAMHVHLEELDLPVGGGRGKGGAVRAEGGVHNGGSVVVDAEAPSLDLGGVERPCTVLGDHHVHVPHLSNVAVRQDEELGGRRLVIVIVVGKIGAPDEPVHVLWVGCSGFLGIAVHLMEKLQLSHKRIE